MTELGSERTAGTWIAEDGEPGRRGHRREGGRRGQAGGRPAQDGRVQQRRPEVRHGGAAYGAPGVGHLLGRRPRLQRGRGAGRQHRLPEGLVEPDRPRRGDRRVRADGAHRGHVHDAAQRRPAHLRHGRALLERLQRDRRRERLHAHRRALRSRRFRVVRGRPGPAGDRPDDQSNFPGSDFSLVQYLQDAPSNETNVVSVGDGRGVRITSVGEAAVGQRVFRSGSTSGFRNGEVTGLDATVNYPEGTVSGLIETTVCAEPGDSGGPMFSEGVALGVTSGGNGDCEEGGTTFFQPLSDALDDLGVRLTGLPSPPPSRPPRPTAPRTTTPRAPPLPEGPNRARWSPSSPSAPPPTSSTASPTPATSGRACWSSPAAWSPWRPPASSARNRTGRHYRRQYSAELGLRGHEGARPAGRAPEARAAEPASATTKRGGPPIGSRRMRTKPDGFSWRSAPPTPGRAAGTRSAAPLFNVPPLRNQSARISSLTSAAVRAGTSDLSRTTSGVVDMV